MKFNLLSDLHLEQDRDKDSYYDYVFPCTADNLILAGDIGNVLDAGYEHFLLTAAKLYVIVIFILGNHEPYGSTYKYALETSRKIASKAPNLYFLEKDVLEVEDTVIMGTTLQSYIPEDALINVNFYLADFRYIDNWNINEHINQFKVSTDWIESTVNNYNGDKKILLVTHHAPTMIGSCNPRHERKKTIHGFASELTYQPFWLRLQACVFGHTHFNVIDKLRNGVELLTNMQGYQHENVEHFSPSKIFSV